MRWFFDKKKMILTFQYNKEGSVDGDEGNTKHLEFSESEVVSYQILKSLYFLYPLHTSGFIKPWFCFRQTSQVLMSDIDPE